MRKIFGYFSGILVAAFLVPACASFHTVVKPPLFSAHETTIASRQSLARNASAENEVNEVIRYFLEIALGSEYGMGAFTVKKWKTDLKVEILGQPTPEDLQTVSRVIEELNQILAPQIRIDLVPAEGNVQVYFVPDAEFYKYEPQGIVYHGGFFWNWWNTAGELYQARVVIAADRISQRLRSHLIREELTQALGLMNDSRRYKDSIFYQDYSETTEFSELDCAVIQLLYREDILPGMSDIEVKEVLRRKVPQNRH